MVYERTKVKNEINGILTEKIGEEYLLFIFGSFAKRSEEHTSELQSHSFISYAVFCLKKKKYKIIKICTYYYE